MNKHDNQPKVRVGNEAKDLDFLLNQVANGDLVLAYTFTMPHSHVGNLLNGARDAIQAARQILRDALKNGTLAEQLDFAEVKLANS